MRSALPAYSNTAEFDLNVMIEGVARVIWLCVGVNRGKLRYIVEILSVFGAYCRLFMVVYCERGHLLSCTNPSNGAKCT